ncbi:hypothetical protein P8X30_10670 [Pyrococcus kukulkanii]
MTNKLGEEHLEKIKRGCYCGYTCNLVYFDDEWHLLDLTKKEGWLSDEISEVLFERKLLPVFAIIDFEELNVNTRSEMYIKAFKKARDFLLVDFQRNRLYEVWKFML